MTNEILILKSTKHNCYSKQATSILSYWFISPSVIAQAFSNEAQSEQAYMVCDINRNVHGTDNVIRFFKITWDMAHIQWLLQMYDKRLSFYS